MGTIALEEHPVFTFCPQDGCSTLLQNIILAYKPTWHHNREDHPRHLYCQTTSNFAIFCYSAVLHVTEIACRISYTASHRIPVFCFVVSRSYPEWPWN
jgi:hypothetical protein